jgi:hypothetical protein
MRERTRLHLVEGNMWHTPRRWRNPVWPERTVQRDLDERHLARSRPEILLRGASDLILPDRAQEGQEMLLTTSAGSEASFLQSLPQISPYLLSPKRLPTLAPDSLALLLPDAVIPFFLSIRYSRPRGRRWGGAPTPTKTTPTAFRSLAGFPAHHRDGSHGGRSASARTSNSSPDTPVLKETAPPEMKRYSLSDRPAPTIEIADATPRPSPDAVDSSTPPPDTPNTPGVESSLAALKSSEALQRRASKRFSTYTFSKMTGAGGGPTLGAARKSLAAGTILTPGDLAALTEADEDAGETPMKPKQDGNVVRRRSTDRRRKEESMAPVPPIPNQVDSRSTTPTPPVPSPGKWRSFEGHHHQATHQWSPLDASH